MIIKILIRVGTERVAVVMTAVAVGLEIEIEIDHRIFIISADVFQAQQQERIGIKRVERADGCFEISKEGDGVHDDDNDVRRAEDLPRVFAVQLQHASAKLLDVFGFCIAVEV